MSYDYYNQNQNFKSGSPATRIAGGLLVVIICALISLSLFGAFGGVGAMVKSFMVGSIGFTAFAYSIGGFFVGIFICVGKKVSLPAKKIVHYVLLFAIGILILHINSSRLQFLDTATYGEYLKAVYGSQTAGGVIAGIFMWPLMKLFTPAFAMLFVFLVFAGFVLITFYPHLPRAVNAQTKVSKIKQTKKPTLTHFGLGGEQPQSNTVGDSLYLGTVFEDGVFEHPKKPTRRERKSRSFNLLFPNQEKGFEGADTLVEPVFDGGKIKPKKNTIESGEAEMSTSSSTFTPFDFDNFKHNDSLSKPPKAYGGLSGFTNKTTDFKKKDGLNTTLLPFMFAKDDDNKDTNEISKTETADSFDTKNQPPVVDIHKPKEEQIKEFQNKFKYLFETEVSSEDILGSGIKNKEKYVEPEVVEIAEEQPADDTPSKEELIENFNKRSYKKLPDSIKRILDGETTGRTVLPPIEQPKDYSPTNDDHPKKVSIIPSYDDADLDFRPQKTKKVEPTILSSGKVQDYVGGGSLLDDSFDEDDGFVEKIEKTEEKSGGGILDLIKSADKKNTDNLSDNGGKKTLTDLYRPKENKAKTTAETNFLENGGKSISVKPFASAQKPKLKDSPQISIYDKMAEMKARPYKAPLINLLDDYVATKAPEDFTDRAAVLEQTLSDFKISAKVVNITQGPTFSRFELKLASGIRVDRIFGLEANIALDLGAEKVRIVAPIPGTNFIGVEVPNKNRLTVSLKSLIQSPEFNMAKSPLTVCLGKDITNANFVADIEKMPHLLVAGTTGSGKSVCINAFIISLLYKASPEDLRFILIDPKHVELSIYSGLPHMLIEKVVDTPEKASNALGWALGEMDRRYNMVFEPNKVKSLEDYNKLALERDDLQKLPRIVIIIDELANLIMSNRRDFEEKITKLASLARAAGIHLIVATQRPSADCVTGSIKTNLSTAIAFAVPKQVDSRVILDDGGAEMLLGNGDMLYKAKDKPNPHRMQGCFVSGEEVVRVVEYVKQNNASFFDDDAEVCINRKKTDGTDMLAADSADTSGDDRMFKKVVKFCIDEGEISIGRLQRKYHWGYNRAANVIEEMSDKGYLDKHDGGNKPRKVFITMDDFRQIFGEDNDE